MNLNTFFEHLDQVGELTFVLPNGTYVPPHFHLTEVALVSKKFVDCGGTMRDENVISFRLWSADDYDHRLAPCRAYGIVERAQKHSVLETLMSKLNTKVTPLVDTDWNSTTLDFFSPPNKPTASQRISAG